jgi:hypothetical protein
MLNEFQLMTAVLLDWLMVSKFSDGEIETLPLVGMPLNGFAQRRDGSKKRTKARLMNPVAFMSCPLIFERKKFHWLPCV